jgi:hypothetical protein
MVPRTQFCYIIKTIHLFPSTIPVRITASMLACHPIGQSNGLSTTAGDRSSILRQEAFFLATLTQWAEGGIFEFLLIGSRQTSHDFGHDLESLVALLTAPQSSMNDTKNYERVTASTSGMDDIWTDSIQQCWVESSIVPFGSSLWSMLPFGSRADRVQLRK